MEITLIALPVMTVFGLTASWLGKKYAQKAMDSHRGLDELAKGIRDDAERQRKLILEEAEKAAQERFEEQKVQLDQEIELISRVQKDFEQELNGKQSELDKRNAKLDDALQKIENRQQQKVVITEKIQNVYSQQEGIKSNYKSKLSERSHQDILELAGEVEELQRSTERLGLSKWMIENSENIKTDSRKFASTVLKTVLDRYSPTFVWPRTIFSVEIPEKANWVQKHFGDGSTLVSSLIQGTDSLVELTKESDGGAQTIRISGGFGVDKEVIRLTLEDALKANTFDPKFIQQQLNKHRNALDKLTLYLGQEAVKGLQLKPMDDTLLKLVGALNYRTSHRQNQYFHTVEVARLAGMLADELGVDHEMAKRSGLLHDIGKVLDYKIEGSHAVISGDYATRFGEGETVVDTVLAHHDDKIVETPFAYILKTADALSGARPGARVEVEDGFQKRVDSILDVVNSFQQQGITHTAVMAAGREVHVFVDSHKIRDKDVTPLVENIVKKLQSDVHISGQIKVTVVRRVEVSEVA